MPKFMSRRSFLALMGGSAAVLGLGLVGCGGGSNGSASTSAASGSASTASGSGKSTFLRCLNRLEEVTSGEILVDGESITGPKADVDRIRRHMGMVFQQFNLFPHYTVKQNLMWAPVELKLKTKEEAEK